MASRKTVLFITSSKPGFLPRAFVLMDLFCIIMPRINNVSWLSKKIAFKVAMRHSDYTIKFEILMQMDGLNVSSSVHLPNYWRSNTRTCPCGNLFLSMALLAFASECSEEMSQQLHLLQLVLQMPTFGDQNEKKNFEMCCVLTLTVTNNCRNICIFVSVKE